MSDCIFCRIIRKDAPAQVVFESENYIAFLDKHPKTRGHLQLLPKKHVTWIYELPDIGNFFITAQRIIHAIIPALGADHVTIATFGHEIAHAHLWIVPQYNRSERIVTEGHDRQGGKKKEDLTIMLRNILTKEVSV